MTTGVSVAIDSTDTTRPCELNSPVASVLAAKIPRFTNPAENTPKFNWAQQIEIYRDDDRRSGDRLL
jgi:hypothetical protein